MRRDHGAGLLVAAAIASAAAPAAADDPKPDPLPWYAPKTIPYVESMPIPLGYELGTARRNDLVYAGAAVFGVSWLASVLTAATVVAGNNRHRAEVAPLFAPFAGPWITLGTSRDAALADPDRRTNGALLIVDGVAQIGGAALFIAGLVLREPVLVRTTPKPSLTKPEVLVSGRGAALRWTF